MNRISRTVNYQGKKIRFDLNAVEVSDAGFEMPWQATFKDFHEALHLAEQNALAREQMDVAERIVREAWRP